MRLTNKFSSAFLPHEWPIGIEMDQVENKFASKKRQASAL